MASQVQRFSPSLVHIVNMYSFSYIHFVHMYSTAFHVFASYKWENWSSLLLPTKQLNFKMWIFCFTYQYQMETRKIVTLLIELFFSYLKFIPIIMSRSFILYRMYRIFVNIDLRNKKWKSSALLPSNLPSVIDRSNLSPSREAARWLIWSVDDTRQITRQ